MRRIRLGWETIALYGVTSLLAVLATADLDVGNRLVVSLVTTLVAVAVASILRPFVTHLGALLVVAGAVGAVRGAVLVTVLSWYGAAERPDVFRVLSSTISAVIWLTVLAFAFGSRDAYRTQYAAAVRQVALLRVEERLDALPEVVELKSALGAAVDSTGNMPSQESLRAAAAVLRAEIEERVRPLSHRIWFSAGSLQPHARIGRLVRDAVIAFPVPVWAVVIVWTLSSFVGAPVIYGPAQGFVSAVACGVLLLASLLVARFVMRRVTSTFLGPVFLISCSILPVLGTIAVASALGFTLSASASLATFVLVPLAIGALLIAASSIALANADRALILRIVEARANANDPWPSTDVSSYLHNSLQSELAGLALQLDHAEPGSAAAQQAVERLAALASRSIADDFRSQRRCPVTRLMAGAAAWRGIADVSIQVDDSVSRLDERLPTVVQAVEEVTSNAIRHGGAQVVRVRVCEAGNRLAVEVESDGIWSETIGTGMGASWLASVACAPVAFQPCAGGTLVRVEFAPSATTSPPSASLRVTQAELCDAQARTRRKGGVPPRA